MAYIYGKGRLPGAVARPLLGKKARAGLRKAVSRIALTPDDLHDEGLVKAVQWLRSMAEFYERDDVKKKLHDRAAEQKAYKASKKLDGEK